MIINGFLYKNGVAIRVDSIKSIKVRGQCITFIDNGELTVDMGGNFFTINGEYSNFKARTHQDLDVEFKYSIEILGEETDIHYNIKDEAISVHYDTLYEYTAECQNIISERLDKIMFELISSGRTYNIKDKKC